MLTLGFAQVRLLPWRSGLDRLWRRRTGLTIYTAASSPAVVDLSNKTVFYYVWPRAC